MELNLLHQQIPKLAEAQALRTIHAVRPLRDEHLAATRSIPGIALTALAMKGDEERIRAAGCDGYIAKPLAYRDFLATIATHLVKATT